MPPPRPDRSTTTPPAADRRPGFRLPAAITLLVALSAAVWVVVKVTRARVEREVTDLQLSPRPKGVLPETEPADDPDPLAQFGGVAGPRRPAFDNAGSARQIVFVCDASKSMLGRMATLKDELMKAVDGLKADQSFNIVFLQFLQDRPDGTCAAMNDRALVPATADNKRKAYTFVDSIATTGTADPTPALALAFVQNPQLIYLLTDGPFPGDKAVTARIGDLNRDHKTRINIIAFIDGDDADANFLDLLREIARENGGTFKRVPEDELN